MSIARPGDAEDSNVTTEEHEQVNQHFNVAVSVNLKAIIINNKPDK